MSPIATTTTTTSAPPSAPAPPAKGSLTHTGMIRAGELVTGKFARPLIVAAGLDPTSTPASDELLVLDNGCGSGVVAATLMGMLGESQRGRVRVMCGDTHAGMVGYVKERIGSEGWEGVQAEVIDAQDTKLPSSSYTHVLSALLLMLVPDPAAALGEIYRVLRPGGTNAFTTWHSTGWVPLVQSAFAAVPGCPAFPPEERYMDVVGTGRWDRPAFIREQVEKAGFVDVEVEQCRDWPSMESPEAFVRLFGDMCVGFGMKWCGEEARKEYMGKVKKALLKLLEERYGEGKPWKFEMVANVVTCKKPSA